MLEWVSSQWVELNVFRYISFRVTMAAIFSLVLSLVLGPLVIKITTRWKLNQSIREDGPKAHLQKTGTPTMGGILIIGSTLISVFLWQDFSNQYVWILIFTIVGFGALGAIDDLLKINRKNSDGLMARVKLTGQFVLAIIIACWIYVIQSNPYVSEIYMPFYKFPIFDLGIFWIPVAVFIIVGASNAVNLTDGLDGLASSLLLIALGTFGIVAYLSGHSEFASYLNIPFLRNAGETTIVIASLFGACLGFLWYNCHPARIMMGDTGSLSLGAALGVIALLIKRELLLVVIAAVFIIEVLSVMIQVIHFKRTGKRVFKMSPIHHHFELLGWAEPTIVTRFTIIGTLFAFVALLSLKVQ